VQRAFQSKHTNSREGIREKRSARSVELYQSLFEGAKRKNTGFLDLRSSRAKGLVGVRNMRGRVAASSLAHMGWFLRVQIQRSCSARASRRDSTDRGIFHRRALHSSSIVVGRGAVHHSLPPSPLLTGFMRAGEVAVSAGKYHDSTGTGNRPFDRNLRGYSVHVNTKASRSATAVTSGSPAVPPDPESVYTQSAPGGLTCRATSMRLASAAF